MTLATTENVVALDRSAELISDPLKWCAGMMAMDDDGMDRQPKDPAAVCWCAYGALAKHDVSSLECLVTETAIVLYEGPLIYVNDEFGRIPAKHCIEALAAELRSQLP